MRVINRSVTALLLTVSTLALAGCLGTNYPPAPPAAINESASGTGFVATRGAGFEDIQTSATGTAGTIGAGGNAALTAFTNATSGAYGFTLLAPLDTLNAAAFDATLAVSGFTTVTGAGNIFVGAQQSSTATPIATFDAGTTTPTTNVILVDKFGASKGLQDTEYGVWTQTGATATAGLSGTAATTAGVFAVGIPTTIMPTGTATYTGGAAGIATNGTAGGEFAGTALLSANFGTGVITGVITGPSGTLGAPTPVPFAPAGGTTTVGTMNAINFTAGTIAGNTFAGTAAATGAAGSGIDITGSSGNFGGTFNGVSAAEIAGTFKVTGGGNTAAVVGSFGAKQP